LLIEFFTWFVCSAMFSILLDARLWPTTVGYTLGFLAAAWALAHREADFFELGMYIMAASHFVLTLTLFVAWRPKSIRRIPDEVRSG
jgi:hypothetical protein